MVVGQRAAELDERIRRTDDLIDEIVYDLYGLTGEEIVLVKRVVGEQSRPHNDCCRYFPGRPHDVMRSIRQ